MMVTICVTCNADCKLNVSDLMTCKAAVSLSNPTSPSAACCAIIKGLNADDIQCLCTYKTNQGGMLRAFGVDPNRCTELPASCGLSPVKC
ncbi:hypothetical protein SOVF_190250 [Spinacia oleracea]|nr:hypothetical protein SOVF_190250 [Spinacia oleracea]